MIEKNLEVIKEQIKEIDISIINIELEIQNKIKEMQGLKKLRNSFQNILKSNIKIIPEINDSIAEKMLDMPNKKVVYSMNEGDSEEWYEKPVAKQSKIDKKENK
jgi:hypothetical protein